MVNQYLPAPNLTTAPDGPIQLGTILRNLDDFDPINRQIAAIPETDRFPVHTQAMKTFSLDELHSASLSFAARALGFFGLGTGASIERTKGSNNRISCERFETYVFNPTESYIKESIKDKDVAKFLRSSRFKPVYLVTGLKVARGASSTSSTGRVMALEHDASVLPSEAPASLGVKASYARGMRQVDKWESSTDFIVAFKVRKVRLGRNQEIKHELYTKRAIMQDGTPLDSETDLTLEYDDDLTPEEVEKVWEKRNAASEEGQKDL
ncbi:hypothetical protein H9Q72_001104 [Fusarium xylarioides]|uniref:Uncharacterized protein n=1 Tax=Fusarium xylarioides TaxID=221167 RepID=A0A9P7LC14_9HYPO|nr:hypothetical protein H9Q72_001104 [Fusarium xylarioides]